MSRVAFRVIAAMACVLIMSSVPLAQTKAQNDKAAVVEAGAA